jgi:aminoglycoside/choline kinase family phosphotransferase
MSDSLRNDSFLKKAGWGDAVMVPLPGDASTRRYGRLTRRGETAMLMHQPQGAESATAPAGASEAERRALGYNAVARLAGADCGRFAAVAAYLRGRGLAAPRIHAADLEQGYAILEDFGDDLFAEVLSNGASEEELYRVAVEVLARIHAEGAPEFLPSPVFAGDGRKRPASYDHLPRERADARAGEADLYPLHQYDEVALIAETDLLTEWFLPLALGRAASDSEMAEHRGLWRQALDGIAASPPVFVHRDYHAQNLIWMPQREGLARVGLIDFQDAVAGSRAYDLVSLLEDARRDVPPAIAEMATRHYLAAMRAQGAPVDETAFRHEMAVMAAQRNAKIVGIFARLYKRDGKARYLALLPRVWRHLERDLAHPSLAPLRAWYDRTIPTEVRALREQRE